MLGLMILGLKGEVYVVNNKFSCHRIFDYIV